MRSSDFRNALAVAAVFGCGMFGYTAEAFPIAEIVAAPDCAKVNARRSSRCKCFLNSPLSFQTRLFLALEADFLSISRPSVGLAIATFHRQDRERVLGRFFTQDNRLAQNLKLRLKRCVHTLIGTDLPEF